MSSDSKALRRYQAGVERALGLFDATNEWADYIAFLGRLLKALQAAPADADVPSKTTLARCLAQCLRPTLPAGVHQKALEVYGIIFTLLGREGLSRDLPLYLPGISHTLSFASLSTRPWFLALYDEHVLRLSSLVLRPALKAIILSLLPGIEEENSEDFDKTLTTLNRLRAAFARDQTEDIFWQCLFLASLTSPNRRMGVLVYLSRYLPKCGQLSDPNPEIGGEETAVNGAHASIQAVVTPEPGLLIRCFATGLQDEQPLVQRGFLDLLVTHLPLKASTLQHPGLDNDLDILVSSAMSIVLRRDISLNRRLWAWFFGSEDKSGAIEDGKTDVTEQSNGMESAVVDKPSESMKSSTYFSDYGLKSVIRTFEKVLQKKSPSPSTRARPFRIMISLLDRSNIGGPVVETMFEPMIHDLRQYQTNAPSQEAFDEVFRSANVFFDSVEPRLIARNLLKLFRKGNIELVEFIAVNFSLDDDEMIRQHIPVIALALSSSLLEDLDGGSDSRSFPSSQRTEHIAKILGLLLSTRLGVVLAPSNQIDRKETADDWMESINRFYETPLASENPRSEITIEGVEHQLFKNITQAIMRCLWSPSMVRVLDYLSSIFEQLYVEFRGQQAIREVGLLEELSRWVQEASKEDAIPFELSRNVAALITAIQTPNQGSSADVPDTYVLNVIPYLTEDFWHRLSPSTPQYHVESVEAIWTLRSLSSNLYLVDSTIMSLLIQTQHHRGSQEHPMSNFGVLWTHTKLANSSFTGLSNGEVPDSETDPAVLLRTALLYVLDTLDMERNADPFLLWMTSLPSLSLHFQAVLQGLVQGSGNSQEVSTGLHRLLKLIIIAKSSPPLWKEFLDPQGPLTSILERTKSIVVSSPEHQDWVLSGLSIIRVVHDGSDVLYDSSMFEFLCRQITATPNGSAMQSSILHTLQSLINLTTASAPPSGLLTTLMTGISSPDIDANLDKWITLLCNAIPLYSDSVFFASLLKLTECFCKRIQAYFAILQLAYEEKNADRSTSEISKATGAGNPERSITNLLAGLEYILARAHTKVTEGARPTSTNQDGVNETQQPRALANNRLTAVLCMQDAIKVCGQVWYWRPLKKASLASSDSKSFNYMSSRLRSRSRRMLEHLIDAEPQECLETLMGMWVEAVKQTSHHTFVINLLETLDGARPKFMMPAIFNAIYGRTNPGALDRSQRSSLSVDITALELVAFLTDYVSALEDDLLEEIWSDCTSFLRDILANPMPHRQILLRLLEFLSVLCQKMENTTFGDQFRMRRELADLCARLFTAIFTIKPTGFDLSSERLSGRADTRSRVSTTPTERFSSGNGIEILCRVLPSMSPVLSEADRITSIYSGIGNNVTGPLLKSRAFPTNITGDVLELLNIMSKAQNTTKIWRKEILDAFNDPKFFQAVPITAESGWTLIIKQLAVLDKGLVPETLSRLTAPATAGIMFGVGATAARTEADKQAKINLRRIALLLIANDKDAFVTNLAQIMAKVEELLTATPSTSPSSSTKGDIFLLLRAISLAISQNNLVSLWPVIDSELRGMFEDIAKSKQSVFTAYSHMQAAKLLDLLLLIKPEEFQLHEWLYVTDTIDAIYPPAGSKPSALADTLALNASYHTELQSATPEGGRKPWLCTDVSRSPRDHQAVLGSFFGHLSIRAFEDTYSLEPVDYQACRRDVIIDMFTDGD